LWFFLGARVRTASSFGVANGEQVLTRESILGAVFVTGSKALTQVTTERIVLI
jgi:hypothetical protein